MIDYSDPNQLVLTDNQGWGWTAVPGRLRQPSQNHDDIKQARAEIERELGGFFNSVKVGVNYTDRSKRLTAYEGFLEPGGTGTCRHRVGSSRTRLAKSPFRRTPSSERSTSFRGFGPLLMYDPRSFVDDGTLVHEVNPGPGERKSYKVTEKVWTPYLMAKIKGSAGKR